MPLRAHMLPAYSTIMLVICAGMFGFSWWAFAAGTCALALASLTSPIGSFAIYGRSTQIAMSTLFFSMILNATAAAATSFALGRLIAWLWGL